MTWFKVDDSFQNHPKVLAIPRRERLAAVGLWTMTGNWCAKQLTNGHLAASLVEEFGGTKKLSDRLVEVGLWETTATGFVFHNWERWQPTREQVEARRKDDAQRKAEWRASKAAKQARNTGRVPDVSQRDSGRTPSGVLAESALPDPTRPDPTRPLVVETSRGGSPSVTREAPPPRKCAQHRNSRDAPSCGACKDARLEREDWDKAIKDRPTLSVKPTMCGDHPDQPALNCPDCAAVTRTDVEALANIRAEIRKRTA